MHCIPELWLRKPAVFFLRNLLDGPFSFQSQVRMIKETLFSPLVNQIFLFPVKKVSFSSLQHCAIHFFLFKTDSKRKRISLRRVERMRLFRFMSSEQNIEFSILDFYDLSGPFVREVHIACASSSCTHIHKKRPL